MTRTTLSLGHFVKLLQAHEKIYGPDMMMSFCVVDEDARRIHTGVFDVVLYEDSNMVGTLVVNSGKLDFSGAP